MQGFGFNASCQITDYSYHRAVAGFIEDTFVASTTIYQIGHERSPDGRGWADTGVKINATFFLGRGDSESDGLDFRFRSHICNLTAGTRTYDIELKNGTVALLGNTSASDSFEKM